MELKIFSSLRLVLNFFFFSRKIEDEGVVLVIVDWTVGLFIVSHL